MSAACNLALIGFSNGGIHVNQNGHDTAVFERVRQSPSMYTSSTSTRGRISISTYQLRIIMLKANKIHFIIDHIDSRRQGYFKGLGAHPTFSARKLACSIDKTSASGSQWQQQSDTFDKIMELLIEA